jgi:hypothetical protein
MTQTNTQELAPFTTVDTAEQNVIEGGVWWCGTGLPNNGLPLPRPPVTRDVFGDPIPNKSV